jgi:SAM-dependent methyltransferase
MMENEAAKEFYNTVMPEKFGDDYEYTRWFKDSIRRAGYAQTKSAIERHVLSREGLEPTRILELGPGAGTWTRFLIERFPDTYIDLLDISSEMLARSRSTLGVNDKLNFIEADILKWTPEGTYDFFFSSRVLEYISDKRAFAKKVFESLAPGSNAFLITKMPHYERERFLGRKTSDFHHGQIAPVALKDTLHEAGFIDVDLFPVTVSVPLLRSAILNRLFGAILARWKLGPFGMFFTESYCVLFRKP